MAIGGRLEVGTVFAHDFRVLRLLAEGGMGTVYVAEQLSTGKHRALKVLHAEIVSDQRVREQFAQEARIGALIGSAHIVDVVASGIDDATGKPWLAMEYLEGEDLSAVVARTGGLALDDVRTVFEHVGEALRAAHRAGVVHRDIKPENLFLARSGLRGMPFVVKVLDFGIAKMMAHNFASASVTRVLGSPLWLAPEQAQPGSALRPATDVWALGLVAYYLLTGVCYWKSANHAEINLTAVLVEVAIEPLVPASVRAAEQGVAHRLPPGFDAWFSCCVVRDADARFVDGGVACDALVGLLRRASAAAQGPVSLVPYNGLAHVSTGPVSQMPQAPSVPPPVTHVAVPAPAPPRSKARWVLLGVVLVLALVGVGVALAVSLLARGATPTTCEAGAAAACVAEGERYAAGRDVTADPARAAQLFDRACTLGSAEGCGRLGDTLSRGRGRDAAKAATAYQRACDGGRLEACVSMGRMLVDGRGVQRDRLRAVQLFQRACDGRQQEGCVRLAAAKRDGAGTSSDRAQAARLFLQACSDNNADGCMELGLMHLRGPGVTLDPVRGLSLLERACGLRSGDACRLLGDRYAEGRGVEPDAARSTEFYRRARAAWWPECEARKATACIGLADLTAAGLGGPADVPGATRLYHWVSDLYGEGCDRRGGPRCGRLAAMYEAGQGVPVDRQQAAALRERACEGGDSEVCVTLGDTYRLGRGVAVDADRAAPLYARARAAFQAPCAQGDLGRCVSAADLVRDGLGGPPDRAAAAAEYQRICAAGERRGCERLGALLQREGEGQDLARAATVLQAACDGGSSRACVDLGRALTSGENVARSVAYFQRACDGGESEGCSLLGGAYLRGQGVAADTSRALALFERACVADDFEACHSAARLLSAARPGVAASPERARRFNLVACRGGVREACGSGSPALTGFLAP
ncbi:MAG: serine/threonine-protein kinase [Polyangiales bacterium]